MAILLFDDEWKNLGLPLCRKAVDQVRFASTLSQHVSSLPLEKTTVQQTLLPEVGQVFEEIDQLHLFMNKFPVQSRDKRSVSQQIEFFPNIKKN